MPRLTPATIRYASHISPQLPLLLRECRDITSAKNELRWLREFVKEQQHYDLRAPPHAHNLTGANSTSWRQSRRDETLLATYVKRRARGEPLQYILGTQPFGDLEILCRPNVLIPRPETENYTAGLVRLWQRLQQNDQTSALMVADFCTGSGCISLLLHSLFRPPHQQSHRNVGDLQIFGFDVSQAALESAKDNLEHNIRHETLHKIARDEVHFAELDVLALASERAEVILDRLGSMTTQGRNESADGLFDIIISNPPYISPDDFRPGGQTTKSVRKYEPRLALVPPTTIRFRGVDQADQFYAALLRIASATRPKVMVMEVGDTQQAMRVRHLCKQHCQSMSDFSSHQKQDQSPWIEIWRDDGSILSDHGLVSGGQILGSLQSPFAGQANKAINIPGSHETVNVNTHNDVNGTKHLEVDIGIDIDIDTESECRAVVVWFDASLLKQRRNQIIST